MGKTLRGWCLLGLWGLGLWLFFGYFTPILEDMIPAWKRYNRIQEEYGLDSGALYYTNVPQTQDAERITRSAVAAGMAERRARMQQVK